MPTSLTGFWKNDPDHLPTLQRYGEVTIEFKGNGELVYTIMEADKKIIMLLTYEVDGNILITDQPSNPQLVRTKFILDREQGRLQLFFEGEQSKWVLCS